jgi:hypothetical protein
VGRGSICARNVEVAGYLEKSSRALAENGCRRAVDRSRRVLASVAELWLVLMERRVVVASSTFTDVAFVQPYITALQHTPPQSSTALCNFLLPISVHCSHSFCYNIMLR